MDQDPKDAAAEVQTKNVDVARQLLRDGRAILLYDGTCGLCDRGVSFALKRNRDQSVHFATLQGEVGQTLLRDAGLPGDYFDSMVLLDGSRAHVKSDAAVALSRRLEGYRWLASTRFVPRFLRDFVYDRVAAIRYRLFGRTDGCRVMTPDERGRFLDA
ncbi:MAG: DCC1-like thiol-disulfide oxidoreductase family protein [Planctomycetota bacterium]